MTSLYFHHKKSPNIPPIWRKLQQGFTLIEVMIVVAIISILAGIAIPSYIDYIRRGQLQESFSLMSGFQLRIEQFYQDNRNYSTNTQNPTDCGIAAPTSNRFNFSCSISDSGQAYLLTGTGATGVVKGFVYTIDQQGNRSTTLYKNEASSANCWLDKSPTC